MSGFSSTGFTKKTLEEIRAEIVAELLAKVSATLDLSATQPEGQIVAICAQREAVLWEIVEVLAHSLDPNEAEDWLLDAVCAITGTVREPAKKSKVTVTCNVNAAFSATLGQIMINVLGDSTIRFTNSAAVGPLTAGVHDIEFESVDYGPIVANAGTLTVITAPVSGLNSVINAADAVRGALRETDTALRVRRDEERAATGACTIDSIRADVLEVEGVAQCFVFENTSLVTDENGLPGKSIEVVVFDGTVPEALNQDIADTVWKSKPSGTETLGTTSQNVVSATGAIKVVKFSRATVKNVWLDFVDVTVNPETFPANGADLIKAAVVAYAAGKQNLAVDVVSIGMKSAALSVTGVIDVPTLKLGFAAAPTGTANLAISGREIASLDTSRISVATIEGVP